MRDRILDIFCANFNKIINLNEDIKENLKSAIDMTYDELSKPITDRIKKIKKI